MIINQNTKLRNFNCLCKGDIFMSQGHDYICVSTPDARYNAINLDTGDVKLFNGDDAVEVVLVLLIICDTQRKNDDES